MKEIGGKMLTWTERRAIEHGWESHALIEQVTNPEMKKALEEHTLANIRVIQARMKEIVGK